MKKVVLLIALAMFSSAIFAQKTYVMHYLPNLSISQAESYRGYDMVIVDHEVINTSVASLRYLRQIKPEIKILAYVEKMQWHEPMFPDKPWSLDVVAYLKNFSHWYLHSPDGNNLTFWPGTVMMNIRLDGWRYEIAGKSYSYIEWFTERYLEDIIGAYSRQGIRLDGILDDDLFRDISFLEDGVDSDFDGLPDNYPELDRQWRLGNEYFLKKVREAMGQDFLIIGNGGHGYYMNICDGKQFENFPEHYIGSWFDNLNNAAGMEIALFNARSGKLDNWLFTICSALLLDNTWFSYGQNTPYESKYSLDLGQPLGFFYEEPGGFARRFERGIVHVRPNQDKGWIER
ncbi:hypothetical protein EOL72_00715 [Candidatus Falkowbacteria bacterium]|nr:hypothetical protein [Candidatus Falkowbacteria bacterium]